MPPASLPPLLPVGGVPILLRPASLASVNEPVLLIDLRGGEDGAGDVAPSGSLMGSVDVLDIVKSAPDCELGRHGCLFSN